MRRTERAIEDRAEIDGIIRQCQVCRLGMADGVEPYIVPLCFGYDGQALYFHCALEGRKLDILRRNNRVCFEFDITARFLEGGKACGWGIEYRSAMGVGAAEIIEDLEQKRHGLAVIMAQYSDQSFTFPEENVRRTLIIKVRIDNVAGKQSYSPQ